MSKRTVRIVLATLISLAVVAGVYTSVFGAALHSGASGGRLHVTAGLTTDLGHARSQASSVNSYLSTFDEISSDEGHGCGSEARADPND